MNLAIIPARGGSKRIPGKNIKEFCGKPIIAYSIEAAIKSQCFDKIIVSTDDEEIARVAKKFGAEVPFMRPKELSDDFTGTRAVINHAINYFSKENNQPQLVCNIYATAPFIQIEDIQLGLKNISNSDCDFSFSITSFAFSIDRSLKINESGRISPIYPDKMLLRSQDLTQAYHDAGQFYWGKTDAFLANKSVFSLDSIPVVLPRYRVQDIDTLEDWECAEMMYNTLKKLNKLV